MDMNEQIMGIQEAKRLKISFVTRIFTGILFFPLLCGIIVSTYSIFFGNSGLEKGASNVRDILPLLLIILPLTYYSGYLTILGRLPKPLERLSKFIHRINKQLNQPQPDKHWKTSSKLPEAPNNQKHSNNAPLLDRELFINQEVERGEPWYQTGWAWFWLIFFWPVGFYAFWKRGGEGRIWIASFFGLLVLAAFLNDPDAPVTSLSKDRAITACSNAWKNEAFGDNFVYYSPIKFKSKWALETGTNKYRAVIEFTLQNSIKRFACDVFIEDGKVMYRVTNNGGLFL